MVGVIIGSGIFRSPAGLAKTLGSPWLIELFWLLGGLLSLAGALTYAELATMYPRSGGVYVFLREGFGELTAFVFGWAYMVLVKPFAAGGIAIVFAENLNVLLGLQWDPRFLTCAIILLLTAVNTLHVDIGAGVAVVLTTLKVGALVAIVTLAVVGMHGNTANMASIPVEMPLGSAIAPAMAAVLWTYDGWSDIGAIAGEVRNPQRMLPRIYVGGTLAVTALYLAVNAVYMWMLPLGQIAGTDSVAPLVMQRLIGAGGATAVTLIILASTLGSTHSSIITGARVTFGQARDGLLFSFLGQIDARFGTPAISLWVQAALSCIAVVALGEFSTLIEGFVFVMWIFYALAAAAVFVLRIRRPDAPRPYRCVGYPVVPLVFIIASLGMTVLQLINNPIENRRWLLVLLIGVPIYFFWKAWQRRARGGVRAV